MGQIGFFDLEFRCRELEKNGDPLVKINQVIPWEDFREILERTREKDRKSEAGRKAFDVVLMFKILILQSLYNLSDDAMEYQIRDRISFMRFLGLNIEQRVPDAKTIWLYREQLTELSLVKELFERFDNHLRKSGFKAQKGQIVDASIISVPVQRNSKEQNELIKSGEIPAEWDQAIRRQKDTDARWTQKNGKNYYGYKNHISIDVKHKLIRSYTVTSASVHDSNIFETLLDKHNTHKKVFADSAYRSKKSSQMLKDNGFCNRVHQAGSRWKKLSALEQQRNRIKSKTRARIEHVFGVQLKVARNVVIRAIGQVRAAALLGLRNLAYNIFRTRILVVAP
jgi:transposase, IS5 family